MAERTDLVFHRDAHLTTLQVTITSIRAFPTLDPSDRELFKQGTESDFAISTDATIFHPQGGGQPSDTGTMSSTGSPPTTFEVLAARTSATNPHQVLHFGRFTSPPSPPSAPPFSQGTALTQTLNSEQRLLYSRYHTAGHVLGAAVRHLLESRIEGFDETKASHFPDSAACEFRGAIGGEWKDAIQERLDEYISRDMAVEIEWWDEGDFEANGLGRLTPDRGAMGLRDGEKFRVVRIVGAETYPCGGTHVDSTRLCGETRVKKIGRSKGTSRVGYVLS